MGHYILSGKVVLNKKQGSHTYKQNNNPLMNYNSAKSKKGAEKNGKITFIL